MDDVLDDVLDDVFDDSDDDGMVCDHCGQRYETEEIFTFHGDVYEACVHCGHYSS